MQKKKKKKKKDGWKTLTNRGKWFKNLLSIFDLASCFPLFLVLGANAKLRHFQI